MGIFGKSICLNIMAFPLSANTAAVDETPAEAMRFLIISAISGGDIFFLSKTFSAAIALNETPNSVFTASAILISALPISTQMKEFVELSV